MKSKPFMEFASSHFIATIVGATYQCFIVDCNAAFRIAASTSLNLLLVIVFPALIRRKYLDFGWDLFD